MTTYHFVEHTPETELMLHGLRHVAVFYEANAKMYKVALAWHNLDEVFGYLVANIDDELLCFLILAEKIVEIEFDYMTYAVRDALVDLEQ